MTDPIADMLTIIRNGYAARKSEVTIPFSTVKKSLGEKLKSLGYLEKIDEEKMDSKRMLKVALRYEKGKPEIEGLKRVSKPGLRVYRNRNELKSVYGGLGHAIVSTNQGLLTDKEAKRKQVGGEIICEVW